MSQANAFECNACKLQADSSHQREPFKRCSGCKAVWYCSQDCQQGDWVRHIFNCNSGQTITSAHHLALAVHDITLPQDTPTLVEYGFSRAANVPAQYELLRLYRDLSKRLGISAKTIHKWAIGKCLVDQVAAAYNQLPIDSRGTHYYWFLGNKTILEASAEGQLDVGPLGSFKERKCTRCGLSEGEEDEDECYRTFVVPPLKQCGGCKKVWYCSSRCQKDDWVRHKFDCKIKPGHAITTADHLARAVGDNLLPEDLQTCEDYGFNRAWTSEARSKLFGVYIGLIERMGIPAKEIHQWRIEGRLLQEIKKAFERLAPEFRGGYYPWLLQNQYILDTSLPNPRADPALEMVARGFKYAGMPVPPSSDEAAAIFRTLPENRNRCLYFATIILAQNHPAPHEERGYVTFGFCACADEMEESQLGVRWRGLLDLCTFDELCAAFESSSFLRLFESNGLPIHNPAIIDVLRTSPRAFKSVWPLKQFAIGTDDSKVRPINSVWADYGFMNCTTDAEMLELKSIYKAVFNTNADPLQLHQACLAGKLYEFVGGYYKLSGKKRQKYVRLFKNLYPLPEL